MRKVIVNILYFIVIPSLLLIFYFLYKLKQYDVIAILMVVIACLPFFILFEKKIPDAKEIALISAFCAIIAVSRIVFAQIPGFSPVTAIIMIIAIVFGKEVGFMVGAMAVLISNAFLTHGPWTPFQMFSWGYIGFLSGLFSKKLKNSLVLQLVFGFFAGILFSLLMDVYTVLSIDSTFRLSRYLAVISISLPFTILYVVSNIVFIICFSPFFIKRLERIKIKYELFK